MRSGERHVLLASVQTPTNAEMFRAFENCSVLYFSYFPVGLHRQPFAKFSINRSMLNPKRENDTFRDRNDASEIKMMSMNENCLKLKQIL